MKKLWIPLLFVIQVCLSLPMFSQTDSATMTGTVTDTTGARVPSVEITITSIATGIVRHTRSNNEGVFTVSALATGTDSARFVAKNLAPQQIDDIRLDVGQTYTVPVKLDLNHVETLVEVTAADSGLDQSSAEIGGVVHGSQAQDLPLKIGRAHV